MTHSHDSDSPESERPVRATDAQDPSDAGERARTDDSAEGDDRPRRGLRRGPRSLIARRRAVAKTKDTEEGAPEAGVVAEAPPDGVVAAKVRLPRKEAGARAPRNGAGKVKREAAEGREAGGREPKEPSEPKEGQREGGRRQGTQQKRGKRDGVATPAPGATAAAVDDVFAYVTSPPSTPTTAPAACALRCCVAGATPRSKNACWNRTTTRRSSTRCSPRRAWARVATWKN